MHDHDLDLIASLAEGRLGAEDARLAEESFVGCDRCLSELAAHRASLAATGTAERPGLTMAESAALRRQVSASVGLSPRVEKAPQRRPWLGLATAAAVVVALVAVAPLVNLLSTDSGDASATATTLGETEAGERAEIPAADLEVTASTSAGTAAPATEAPSEAPPLAATAPTEQDGAASESLGALDRDDSLPQSFLDFGAVDELDEFLSEVPEGIDDEAITRALTLNEITYYQQRFSASLEDASITCPAEAALELAADAASVITIGKADLAGVEFLVVLVTRADDTQLVLALDSVTCEVLGQVEQ